MSKFFVVPNDPERDTFVGMATSDDYVGDPHIRVVTWLHLNPHGDDVEMQYREHFRYRRLDGHRFVTIRNETFYRPYVQKQPISRQYMWSAELAGMHALEAGYEADRQSHAHLLRGDKFLAAFMQQTEFCRMKLQRLSRGGSVDLITHARDHTSTASLHPQSIQVTITFPADE